MLYREPLHHASPRKVLIRLFALFDRRLRRQKRVERDLLTLSPYLQRDIGLPW